MINIILAITAAYSLRLKPESRLSALIFCLSCLLYAKLEIHVENNYMYYLFAACVDLAIIAVIARMPTLTATNVNLQSACKYLIYANLCGLIIYHYDFPAIIYTIICTSLYVAVLLIVILRGNLNGLYRDSDIRSNIHFDNFQSKSFMLTNQKAQRA